MKAELNLIRRICRMSEDLESVAAALVAACWSMHRRSGVERVDVQEDALEVRIRAKGLVSLVAELRPRDDQNARGGTMKGTETQPDGSEIVPAPERQRAPH
jgi:hypothetical protein